MNFSGTKNPFIAERLTFFDKAGCQVKLLLCLESDLFNKIMTIEYCFRAWK